jgi:hypothetical protein
MKSIQLCVALVFALVLPATSQQQQPAAAPSSDDAAAIAFVQGFFTAFDARDYAAMERMFLPTAKLVHSDGVEEDVPTMLSTVRSAKHWPPRKRDLSHCETTWIGDAVVVGCLNHVVFEPPGQASVERTYNETWILERTNAGLRAVRTHYSLVTRKEHTE